MYVTSGDMFHRVKSITPIAPYLSFFLTVLSDLEFNIAAGSLELNSFKRVSQLACIPFHLPIVSKP